MVGNLPLLVFPQAREVAPSKGKGFPPGKPHFPGRARQAERLDPKFGDLERELESYTAGISGVLPGLEPEMVLVVEIVEPLDQFKLAVDNTDGLEWLGEWDIEGIKADADFYSVDKKKRTDKPLKGRVFLSFSNAKGIKELLKLWRVWKSGGDRPSGKARWPGGKTGWRSIFEQIRDIRRWGIQETLLETEMIEHWKNVNDPETLGQEIAFQIELFYRQDQGKRKENEEHVKKLLKNAGGETLGRFIDMKDIHFHAVKAKLPVRPIVDQLKKLDSDSSEVDIIELFKFSSVMYFRPTGQVMSVAGDEAGVAGEFPDSKLSPTVAILDGVPSLQHVALSGRLQFDDPDRLESEYQPGERQHGTGIASLVVHGEAPNRQSTPLIRQVYCLPVMQPNVESRNFNRLGNGKKQTEEHFPGYVFHEDRIERAVRRMFEGEEKTPAQAPGVKVINLSLGDTCRPFVRTLSPWARLLDYLSWKYHVLFCVSTGNFEEGINLGQTSSEFAKLSVDKKVAHTLSAIQKQLAERRLLSPAESLNALTVGALHADKSGVYSTDGCVDLLPNRALFSPVSRFGHGFRRSVKPEVLFPGGLQLYRESSSSGEKRFKPVLHGAPPGQEVAQDSRTEGELVKTGYTRGTSNAAALATRSAARIYEVLTQLSTEDGEKIPDNLMAVLMKALLVHGAQQGEAHGVLAKLLQTPKNRRLEEIIARYIGYGSVDVERVLACAEQRGTVLGCGEIGDGRVHEYDFPLPPDLSESKEWRRMVVTLAWFSPINPSHRNLRMAKLVLDPADKWGETPLKLERKSSDHNQVRRGTVQHEILEGKREVSRYEGNRGIALKVRCKTDAAEKLNVSISYGLVVTLEVAEGVGIPVYQQIRDGIQARIHDRIRA